jgi:DNA-binding NtrC family response regulator
MGSAASRASLPTILIVEDEFLARAMLSDHLQECGFMVFEAANADEAIKIIETGLPINLVLTDVRMPGSMNGFGLAKWIGSNTPQISVLIASGEATQTDAANELCDHIPLFKKPYDLKAIVAGIRATLEGEESHCLRPKR